MAAILDFGGHIGFLKNGFKAEMNWNTISCYHAKFHAFHKRCAIHHILCTDFLDSDFLQDLNQNPSTLFKFFFGQALLSKCIIKGDNSKTKQCIYGSLKLLSNSSL
jgi:hypothetical protein